MSRTGQGAGSAGPVDGITQVRCGAVVPQRPECHLWAAKPANGRGMTLAMGEDVVVLPHGGRGVDPAYAIVPLLTSRPDAVLRLVTGSSPIGVYDELGRRHGAGEVALARGRCLLFDEYVGPPATHEQWYRSVMATRSSVAGPARVVLGSDVLLAGVHRRPRHLLRLLEAADETNGCLQVVPGGHPGRPIHPFRGANHLEVDPATLDAGQSLPVPPAAGARSSSTRTCCLPPRPQPRDDAVAGHHLHAPPGASGCGETGPLLDGRTTHRSSIVTRQVLFGY